MLRGSIFKYRQDQSHENTLRQIGTRLLLMRDPDSRTVIVCCTNYGKESLHRNQCYMLLDVVHGLSHWRSGNVGHIEMGYKYAAVSRWTQ